MTEQPTESSSVRQAYWCEACDVRGYVDLDPHAGVFEGIHAIEDDHRSRSPECRRLDAIRVQNESWVYGMEPPE